MKLKVLNIKFCKNLKIVVPGLKSLVEFAIFNLIYRKKNIAKN